MTQLDRVLEHALRRQEPISLDSSALIAYLANEEPIASLVFQLLDGRVDLVLSAIVVSEAMVRTAVTGDRQLLETIVASLHATPRMLIVPFGEPELIETAIVRAETRLKLPDAAIVATARLAGAAVIIGNDRAWQNKPLGLQYIHLDDVLRERALEEGSIR